MKRLLSLVLAAALILAPVSAEAKSRPETKSGAWATLTCSGVQAVKYKHGRKINTAYMVCSVKAGTAQTVPFNVRG